MFLKCEISRYEVREIIEILKFVAFTVGWITKENSEYGSRIKLLFMNRDISSMTQTSQDFHVFILRNSDL